MRNFQLAIELRKQELTFVIYPAGCLGTRVDDNAPSVYNPFSAALPSLDKGIRITVIRFTAIIIQIQTRAFIGAWVASQLAVLN